MFHDADGRGGKQENLDEFDDARQVVASLSAEYEACESADYVSALSCIVCALQGCCID